MLKIINVLIGTYILILLAIIYVIKPGLLLIVGILTALTIALLISRGTWLRIGANIALMASLSLVLEEIIGLWALIAVLPLLMNLDLMLKEVK